MSSLTLKLKSTVAVGALFVTALMAGETSPTTAPTEDRVGFPTGYREKFQLLRTVDRAEKMQKVSVYGNDPAASIKNTQSLPYPGGSVFVMETAEALRNAEGKPLLDEAGKFRAGKVVGLHVMRREKNFGEAYGLNRTGEWEYVEYREDGTYLTPPAKSFTCAACHVKAGPERDFVYRGRFAAKEAMK